MSKKLFRTIATVATVAVAVAAAIPTGGGSTLLMGAAGALGTSAAALSAGAIALSLGASILARPKAPKVSSSPADRLQVSLDPKTPRKFVLGRTAMATDIRDQEFSNDQEYLHRFIVCASHKVQSIDEIWFDEKLAWTAAGGAQGEFAGYLTVSTRTEGSAANAINISARMGSARRYTGLAYLYFRYKLSGNSKKAESPFAQNVPARVTIIGRGAYVYDPRLDSTIPGGSGPCRTNDQSTWIWDDNAARNPALQLLWYLLGWRIQNPITGEWRLAVGKGIPASRIDIASFITAANLCDEPVTLASGGTEPRYRSDCIFSEGDATSLVLDQLKAAMNAELDDVDGRIRITVLHNDLASPVADFDTSDVLDDFDWQQTAPLDETYNVVRGTYIDPTSNSLYQAVDYPEVSIPSPDGIDRVEPVDFQCVQSPSQAQRLVRQRIARMLYSGTFAGTFGHRAWKVQKNDVIRLTFAPLGWTNKLFRVIETAVQVDGRVPMLLQVENAAIYLWDRDERPAIQPVEPTSYDPYLNPLYQDVVEPKYGDGTPIDALKPAEPGATDGMNSDEREEFDQFQQDLATFNLTMADLKAAQLTLNNEVAAARADITANATQIETMGTQLAAQGALVSENWQALNSPTGSLAVLRQEVRAGGNPNLQPNGGLEDGLTGFTAYNTTLGYAVNSWGPYVFWVPSDNPSTLTDIRWPGITDGKVIPTVQHIAHLDVAAADLSGGAYVWLNVIFWGPAGVLSESGRVYKPQGDFGNARILIPFTPPAGTVRVDLRSVSYAPTSRTFGMRLAKVEIGNTPTAYDRGASVNQSFEAINTINTQFAAMSSIVATANANATLALTAAENAEATASTALISVRAGSGGNRADNSALAIGTQGWTAWTNLSVPVTFGRNLAGTDWMISGSVNNLSAFIDGGNTGNPDPAVQWTQRGSCTPLEWLDFSAKLATHNLRWGKLIVQWFSKSGVNIHTNDTPASTDIPTGGQDRRDWKHLGLQLQAPEGAVSYIFYIRFGEVIAGNSYGWCWVSEMQVMGVRQGDASPQPYKAGTDIASASINADAISTLDAQMAAVAVTASTANANATLALTAAQTTDGKLTAKYGVELTAGTGYARFSGFAGETFSGWKFEADYFGIGSGGQTPFEVISGTVYIKNAIIKDSAIVTSKLDGQSVSRAMYTDMPAEKMIGTTGLWIDLVDMTMADVLAGSRIVMQAALPIGSPRDIGMDIEVVRYVNGVLTGYPYSEQIGQSAGTSLSQQALAAVIWTASGAVAGTHRYIIRAKRYNYSDNSSQKIQPFTAMLKEERR